MIMNCSSEPFVLISAVSSCAESPPCSHIFCWKNFNCLIASTLSPIITGCRLDGDDIFCICPPHRAHYRKMAAESITNEVEAPDLIATSNDDSSGLGGGAIAGIVIGCVIGVLLLSIVGFFAFRYMKDRRKNHGEYRPQFEEQNHAKDLPYLQPPNIEGLI